MTPSFGPVLIAFALLVAGATACGHDGDDTPRVCAGPVADDSLDVDELCTADAQCRWPVCIHGYCAAQCDYFSAPGPSFECDGVDVTGTCDTRKDGDKMSLGCAYTCAKSEDCPVLADAKLTCIDGVCEAPSCKQLGE